MLHLLVIAIAFVLAFAYWKILSMLYVNGKISEDDMHALFIGNCIILAAGVMTIV